MNMLRVATLNLRANADRWKERLPLVIASLHILKADVIALQETRLAIGQAQMIVDALNFHASQAPYQVYLSEDWYEPHIMANAFLTHLPIISHGRIELSHGYRTAHRLRLRFNGRDMTIANTHLHHKPHHDEVIRLEQAQHTLAWLEAQNLPTILMGDFNASPDSETIGLLRRYFESAYAKIHGNEPGFTFPTPLRQDINVIPRTIDYILYTPHFEATGASIFGDVPQRDDPTLYASDHLGIVSDIVWR